MYHSEIMQLLKNELKFALMKHPSWPTDPIHASAVVSEECGELTQACLQWVYEKGSLEHVKKEALQTAAMCFRFLVNIEEYERRQTD